MLRKKAKLQPKNPEHKAPADDEVNGSPSSEVDNLAGDFEELEVRPQCSSSSAGTSDNSAGDFEELEAENIPSTQQNLCKVLAKMIKLGLHTDGEICIGEFTQRVHLIVLQVYSDAFREIGNVKKVLLPGEQVTPRAFEIIYNWMREDTPTLSPSGLPEVFRAATFLGIPALVAQCEQYLNDGFEEASAALLYLEAAAFGMEPSYRSFLKRVSKFFLPLVASQEFLDLPIFAVTTLLSSSNIAVNTELEVFMAAVRWLNYRWPEREENIREVASKIRFCQRRWIYDPNSRCHHRLTCQNQTTICSYNMFIEFLGFMQAQIGDYYLSLEPAEASNVCVICERSVSERKDSETPINKIKHDTKSPNTIREEA